jgi:TfoX/Sxy family transcriptional regulator of competence genes
MPLDRVTNDLAAAVRAALRDSGVVREVKMFGGTGFMLDGNLVAAASKRGLLLRVGKDRQPDALARPGARPMEMRGRTMEGYVYVNPAVLDEAVLRAWLRLALAFVQTLPTKPLGQKPKRAKGKPK